MNNNENINDLVTLGLDRARLEQHTPQEIKMALCAVQESGTQSAIEYAAHNMPGISDEDLAALYAESALEW